MRVIFEDCFLEFRQALRARTSPDGTSGYKSRGRIYRLPPLPPTLPALDDLMRCWLQGVVDGFLSAFFVDVDPAFLTFLKQLGSLFGAFWDHFGRLWLLVATFQAHLTPESRRLAHFAKNDSKMGAFLGPF